MDVICTRDFILSQKEKVWTIYSYWKNSCGQSLVYTGHGESAICPIFVWKQQMITFLSVYLGSSVFRSSIFISELAERHILWSTDQTSVGHMKVIILKPSKYPNNRASRMSTLCRFLPAGSWDPLVYLQKPRRISMHFFFGSFWGFFPAFYRWLVCCGVLRFGIRFLYKWIQKRKTFVMWSKSAILRRSNGKNLSLQTMSSSSRIPTEPK